MSERMTLMQVEANNAKVFEKRFGKKEKPPENAFEGKEEELAQLCIAEIRRRRWYFTRNMPGRYSTATAGTPDLIIASPNGVTYWIELKKKSNKLSENQTITKHILLGLSHKWSVCYSYEEFLKAIDG